MPVQNNLINQEPIPMTTKWSKGNWIIGIALFVLAWVWWSKKDNNSINDYKLVVERLKQQNDSLQNDNHLLDLKIDKIRLKADSLHQLVTNKNEAIIYLKRVKNEKIKAIDGYSNDKLYQFFAGVDTNSTRTER